MCSIDLSVHIPLILFLFELNPVGRYVATLSIVEMFGMTYPARPGISVQLLENTRVFPLSYSSVFCVKLYPF